MSVEARKWAWAFEQLGFTIRWIAGDGDGLDVVVPGLAIDAETPPRPEEIVDATRGCAAVLVENLLSLPLNPGALEAVATARRGLPTIVRHHDLPWHRERFAKSPPPPDDGAWIHVTINRLNRDELRDRAGIDATTIYNRFERPEVTGVVVPPMPRPVLLHPTRAIPRKNVPGAIRIAEALGGTYWLLGPAEDGYDDELRRLLARATCPVVHGGEVPIGDAYAACDVVVYPSTWEGFGNPTIESALVRKPLVVGDYPVVEELRDFGFRWFRPDDIERVRSFLDDPDERLLDHNESVALEHFSLRGLPAALRPLLRQLGVSPHRDN